MGDPISGFPPFNEQASSPASQLRQEFEVHQALLRAQPPIIQRFFETQAGQIAEALIQRQSQMRFSLPDRVMVPIVPTAVGSTAAETAGADGSYVQSQVPNGMREQMVGGLFDRLSRTENRVVFRQRLAELEESSDRGVAAAARIIRHVTALHMIHNMLPSGRSVSYTAAEGEEIPTIPVKSELEPESAITASTDAIVEDAARESDRGELLVPYVPAARRFFLPQWVAFDDEGKLLVKSMSEAEGHIASMQHYLEILHAAVGLATYMVAEDQYQEKRYGMLGQLINQGRALATYQTEEIIETIKQRAAAHDLNRGLSLSIPYFDDQALTMKTHRLDVIPPGRIMFVPAFVVRAAREEEAKVAQDTRFSPSTRKYLLLELSRLEKAFLA
jgi:hypothetical protein